VVIECCQEWSLPAFHVSVHEALNQHGLSFMQILFIGVGSIQGRLLIGSRFPTYKTPTPMRSTMAGCHSKMIMSDTWASKKVLYFHSARSGLYKS
jgi:hypothetical protein